MHRTKDVLKKNAENPSQLTCQWKNAIGANLYQRRGDYVKVWCSFEGVCQSLPDDIKIDLQIKSDSHKNPVSKSTIERNLVTSSLIPDEIDGAGSDLSTESENVDQSKRSTKERTLSGHTNSISNPDASREEKPTAKMNSAARYGNVIWIKVITMNRFF